uniref:Uncharacterized protein n=1 Tax=Siphoviridae sp. ct1SN28 TaxID=2825308 RepID=A0A8S5TRL7_9CAUD|nr:MAG TPA: hypothetical protein [Siphoviridae sp. ct1SN28]
MTSARIQVRIGIARREPNHKPPSFTKHGGNARIRTVGASAKKKTLLNYLPKTEVIFMS